MKVYSNLSQPSLTAKNLVCIPFLMQTFPGLFNFQDFVENVVSCIISDNFWEYKSQKIHLMSN